MRIFLIAAVVCFIIALVCFVSPTTVIGADGQVWTVAGLLAWVLDGALGTRIAAP